MSERPWMRLFDELPQSLRNMLNNSPLAPHPDDITGLHMLYHQRGYTEQELVAKLTQAIKRKTAA